MGISTLDALRHDAGCRPGHEAGIMGGGRSTLSAKSLFAGALSILLFAGISAAVPGEPAHAAWKTNKTLTTTMNVGESTIGPRNPSSNGGFVLKMKKSYATINSTFTWDGNYTKGDPACLPTKGIRINFKKLKKGSKLYIRFPSVAVDEMGYPCDMELLMTNWVTKNMKNYGKSNVANIGTTKDGVMAYKTPFNGTYGLQFKTTITFYRHDKNHTKPGSGGNKTPSNALLVAFFDLDMQDWITQRQHSGMAEGIQIGSPALSGGNAIAAIHKSSWLHAPSMKKGIFWRSGHSYAWSDDEQKKCGFATRITNGGNFTWHGTHAYTEVLTLPGSPSALIKKKTDSNSYICYADGTHPKVFSSWKTDNIPWMSKRTYAFKAKKGYAVSSITITDSKNKFKSKKLTTASPQIKNLSTGVYTYSFNKVNDKAGRIYVQSAKIGNGTVKISAKKAVSGPDTSLKKDQFTFELWDAQTKKKLQTKKNAADGTVTFDAITVSGSSFTDGVPITKKYYVIEVAGKDPNYTYDTHRYNVTATLKNVGGKVNTTYSYSGSQTFTNKFSYKPVSVPLSAKKTLSNQKLLKNQFSFQLLQGSSVKQTASNDASGNVNFKNLSFDAPGTYTYTVRESSAGGNGITVDPTVYTVKVTVKANASKQLVYTVAYSKGSTAVKAMTFNNTYSASGTADIVAYKKLEYENLKAGQFEYTLYQGSTALQTATNTAPDSSGKGKVSFPVSFTHEDDGKTHTYTVKETPLDGYRCDTRTLTAKVTAYDNGDGTMTTKVSYSGLPSQTFENTKILSGGVKVKKIWKVKDGTETGPLGGAKFTVYNGEGKAVKSMTSNDDGIAEIPSGLEGGSYTVQETAAPAGYTKSNQILRFKIESNEVVDLTGQPFVNTPNAGAFTLFAKKELEYPSLEAGQFSFQMLDDSGEVVQTKKNDADGSVEFDEVKFEADAWGTERTYRIKEVPDSSKPFEYDSKVFEARISIGDTGIATVRYYDGDDEVDLPTFVNKYKAEGKARITATKTLVNDDEGRSRRPLVVGQFKFVLEDSATGKKVAEASNGADGQVDFGELSFDASDIGEKSYTIREVKENANGIVYDEHEESVVVEVSDAGGGTLETRVIYDDDGAKFENVFSPKANVSLSAKKVLEGAELEDGQFPFGLYDPDGYRILPEEDESAPVDESKGQCSARNDASGKVTFPEIPIGLDDLDENGKMEAVYMIMETPEVDDIPDSVSDKFEYDTHICYVTVSARLVVNDDGSAEIRCSTTYGDDKDSPSGDKVERAGEPGTTVFGTADVFTNIYHKKCGVRIRKVDDKGNPLQGVVFGLYNARTAYMVDEMVTDAQGYATAGVEKNGDETVYTLDDGDYFLIEKLGPEGYAMRDEKYEFSLTEDGLTDLSGTPIVNYPKTGKARIHMKKEYTNGKLSEGMFTFELVDSSTGEVVQTTRNKADGSIDFEVPFTYGEDVLGEHAYAIRERKGDDPDVTYDTSEHGVVITVSELDRQLSCSVDYPNPVSDQQ